jgi:hypothetical protein
MLSPLEFTIILDDTSKRKACDLLASRLASSKLTKDNAQLIAKLLGQSNRSSVVRVDRRRDLRLFFGR